MNKFLLWVCFIFISGIHCFGQNRFSAELNSFQTGGQKRIIALDDGGYITKEVYPDFKASKFYFVLTRFNACSQEIWTRKINSSGNSYNLNTTNDPNLFFDLAVPNNNFIKTTDNGFLLIYYTYDQLFAQVPFAGEPTPIITKLDSSGNVEWSRKINPIINADFSGRYPVIGSCAATKDSGCVVLGYGDSISRLNAVGSDSRSSFVLKLDAHGKEVWSKLYRLKDTVGYSNYTVLNKIEALRNGGFIFNYYNEISGTSLLCKLDGNGKMTWEKYLIKGFSIVTSLSYVPYELGYREDAGKNIYISGTAFINGDSVIHISTADISGPLTGLAPYLLKLDSNGTLKWLQVYFEPSQFNKSVNVGIVITNGNQIMLINSPIIYYSVFNKSIALYIDINGKPVQNKTLNYSNYTYGYGSSGYVGYSMECSPTSDSGLIYAGPTSDSIHTSIYKMNKNGETACNETDTLVTRKNVNITITNAIPYLPAPGFTVSDIALTVSPIREKAKMLCSDHLIPQADISPDTVLCSGKSYVLYKGAQNAGAKTYWSTGDTTDSIIVKKTGKYWLQLSHGYCTSSDTVSIVFKSQIKSGLPKTQSICPYDSVLLSVKDSIASYYWISPKKDTLQGRNITAKDSGYYYLMLKGAQSCASVDTVHVMYYPLPAATAGPDTVLCRDEAYTMQGAGGITYKWIPATYLSSSTDPNAIASLPNTERYILVVSNKQGCHDTSQVLLKVRTPLTVKASVNNAEVCYGQTIVLSAIAHGGDSLHYKFKWVNDAQSGDSITEKAFQSGWYKLIVSDNCTPVNVTDSVYITVIPPAKAAFVYSPATKIKTNHDVSFINQSTNAASYLWTFGTNDSSKQVSPVYIYTDTGDYRITLVAYGFNNCPNDTAYGFIKLITDQVTIYIPNAFSPNGDGVNDYFDIGGVGIKSYSYNIYNRWGEHIYASPQPSPKGEGEGWDGTFHGVEVPEGVYLYQLDVTDIFDQHHYLSGNVTLMR